MLKILKFITCFTLASVAAVVIAISGAFLYLAPDLPDVDVLTDIQLQIPLRIYSADGLLMGEFGEQRRTPIRFDDVPAGFINAFLAAEDDQFYHHGGVSIKGLGRAVYQMLTGSDTQTGGSTITMQVAKNYFLTPERKIIRKVREIFLAIQIEQKLDKQQIIELYINKIFLGHRAYGIVAAAQVYYGKPVAELSLAQQAMIAGLPKAPSDFNPISNPARALERRNWILQRMLKLGYIQEQDYRQALAEPDTARRHQLAIDLHAPYVAEMARQQALALYGDSAYTDGLRVYTTVQGELQRSADEAVKQGLHAYDERHGFRRPHHLGELDAEQRAGAFSQLATLGKLQPAIVFAVEDEQLQAELRDGASITLGRDNGLAGLRPYISENRTGEEIRSLHDIIRSGDVLYVQQDEAGQWQMRQIPEAEAALVSLNPENGAILAMTGGYDFYKSKFNRATQAQRQIGSTIKPFVYAAALANGMTAASIINDAPIVVESAQLEDVWRPRNAGAFSGPTRLREALYHSKNLVSIRILLQIGTGATVDYLDRFGLDRQQLPNNLTLALGSASFSPLTVASAYAVFANGGYRIEPYLIDSIRDSNDTLLYQADPLVVCRDCQDNSIPADNTRIAPRVIGEDVAFIIDSILHDVIQKGTGRKARELGRRDIAGKTGTTNGPTDAWFAGYHPHIVTTAWLGFNNNAQLGYNEYGGSAALPIWIQFMKTALASQPTVFKEQPASVVSVLINPENGKRARPGTAGSVFELIQASAVPDMEMDNQQRQGGDTPISIEELF